MLYPAAVLGLLIEPLAKPGDGLGLTSGGGLEAHEDVPGAAATIADDAVALDVDQVIGMHGAGGVVLLGRAGIALP